MYNSATKGLLGDIGTMIKAPVLKLKYLIIERTNQLIVVK